MQETKNVLLWSPFRFSPVRRLRGDTAVILWQCLHLNPFLMVCWQCCFCSGTDVWGVGIQCGVYNSSLVIRVWFANKLMVTWRLSFMATLKELHLQWWLCNWLVRAQHAFCNYLRPLKMRCYQMSPVVLLFINWKEFQLGFFWLTNTVCIFNKITL